MARILSRAQFAATKVAARPGASYQGYLKYVAQHRGAAPAAAPDALAPADPGQLSDQISAIRSAFGPPLTQAQINGQATQAVTAATAPVVSNIASTLEGRAAQAARAINGYTGSYMDDVKAIPGQINQDYAAARNDVATANRGLTSFIGAQGSADQQAIEAKLKAAGLDAAIPSIHTAGLASGVAGSLAGEGTNALNELSGHRANALAYARDLPAIATLAGQQALRSSTGQMNQAVSDQIGQVESRVPGMVNSIATGLRSQNTADKRAAISLAASMFNSTQGREVQKAIAREGFGVDKYRTDVAAGTAKAAQAAATDRAKISADASAARAAASSDAAYNRELLKQDREDARASQAESGKTARATTAASSKQDATLERATNTAFTKAANDASRMLAGSYGTSGNSTADVVAAIVGGKSASHAGKPWAYQHAYNSIFAGFEAQLGNQLSPQALRKLTLRALLRGGYTPPKPAQPQSVVVTPPAQQAAPSPFGP